MGSSNQKTAEQIIKENDEIYSVVSEETILFDAIREIVAKKVGSILIEKDDEIVGIYTERDLLRNVIRPDFDVKSARIGDYMSRNPKSAEHDMTVDQLMDKFLGLHVRHLVVFKNKKFIGLLSIRDVFRNTLRERAEVLDKEQKVIQWNYYEDWKFKPNLKKTLR